MRRPAIGCFIAGTLVHTKEGLKPIEQIKVGDWVLSRPEDPAQGTETGYKRVSKTFRFEDKEVVRFWWERSNNLNRDTSNWDNVYVTPNHPVWLNPDGWVPMGRLYLPGKRIPGTISRGNGEWLGKELIGQTSLLKKKMVGALVV
jgi:Hint domain